jgi:predicted nucleotidyltransferase
MADPLDTARDRIRTWAAGQPDIARVYLFGSRIRGCCKDGGPVRDDSDLDVAVELTAADEEAAYQRWWDVEDSWRDQLQSLLSWPLHLQWYHPTGTPTVCRHVADCHEVIYLAARAQAPE